MNWERSEDERRIWRKTLQTDGARTKGGVVERPTKEEKKNKKEEEEEEESCGLQSCPRL